MNTNFRAILLVIACPLVLAAMPILVTNGHHIIGWGSGIFGIFLLALNVVL